MVPHTEFAVRETSQVGAARRHAAGMSARMGFDEVAAGRLAIVVTELSNNLVRHASEGRVLLAFSRPGEPRCIEVIALDRGPGIDNVERCMADGFSTGGTPGGGLGSVRRLSREFGMFSKLGSGTIVVARVAASSAPARPPRDEALTELAGVCVAAPHESVSGDSWAAVTGPSQGRLIVADGLGHGPVAAAAADAAVEVFEGTPAIDPAEVLERAHAALQGTRGAAVAIVAYDAEQGTVAVCGAGNISGRLISGVEDRALMMQHGTVGLQIRHAAAVKHVWPPHALLVLHSDGITTRWNLEDVPGLLRCPAIVVAAWILHMHLRGRDDATVVVLRRR
jgi:anti-sigma regulatory factor (Ser/Thr protein kinase)